MAAAKSRSKTARDGSGLGGALRDAIAMVAPRAGGGRAIDVRLPDLEERREAEIVADNVNAVAAIYLSAELEACKFFDVADVLAEQFMTGSLPIRRTPGGEALYRYIKERPQRLTEVERRSIYARVLGQTGGDGDVSPNREFDRLWKQFLLAMSVFTRERELRPLERRVAMADAARCARELAVNLSVHGAGLAAFVAVELAELIRTIGGILGAPDVLAAAGARDRWQLVERVSELHLGGAVPALRPRTQGAAGAEIIRWLADSSRALGRKKSIDPKLLAAVERWLAVAG